MKKQSESDVYLEVRTAVGDARNNQKTVGLVQGSWDMFHLGHLCYLQEARRTCDFLVIAMDDDEKIRYRKGNNRPIIPLSERYQTIERLGLADLLVVKHLGEPHWGLIKAVEPDVLIAIKENYSDDEIVELEKICGRVAVLPRQATTSTSDIIRRTLIKNGVKTLRKKDARVKQAVKAYRERVDFSPKAPVPIPDLIDAMNSSTDPVVPNAACTFVNGKWLFGVNIIDQSLSDTEIEHRTELFYSTVEHAEINLLKKLESVKKLDGPVYVTLLPCDKCLKVLIDKGVKEIRYIEDHPERNWSTRTKALAEKKGVKLVQISAGEPSSELSSATSAQSATSGGGSSLRVARGTALADANHQGWSGSESSDEESSTSSVKQSVRRGPKLELPSDFRFGDPRNAREQTQLDIMVENELNNRDPLDPAEIDQPILFSMEHWFVSKNRFPYDEVEHQFLIIARQPIYKIEKVSPEMWAELKVVWDRLRKDYSLKGGALCFRYGDTLLSGASLKRLHAHLIVPRSGCKTKFSVGGNPGLKDGLEIRLPK